MAPPSFFSAAADRDLDYSGKRKRFFCDGNKLEEVGVGDLLCSITLKESLYFSTSL